MDEWTTRRTLRKVRALIEDAGLDLRGANVYTEAATGAYRIGAALALLAGARSVHCVARPSRFGPAQAAIAETRAFAVRAGADLGRLGFSEGHSAEALATADIVTNMGMLRPIDAGVIAELRPGAVIPLMYEPWEFRDEDVDLAAAERRGVLVVGVNEGHARSDCIGGLPLLVLKALLASGASVLCDDVLLVCGNRFARTLVLGLEPHCRSLDVLDDGRAGDPLPGRARRRHRSETNATHYDALVLLDAPDGRRFNVADDPDALWPRACLGTWDLCIQSMGNVHRGAFPDVRFHPEGAPPMGYMGTNPAGLGPDLVARLVVAGLSAGAEALALLRADPAALRAQANPFAQGWALPLARRRIERL
jgi:hypothetical protein